MIHWRIVLVRPRNPLNIGAAARAMANFGFSELIAVAPYAPVWQETRSAVGAEQVIESARPTEDLQDAVADCTLVVGTTAGSRRSLDRDLIPLDAFPDWLRWRLPFSVPSRLQGRFRAASYEHHRKSEACAPGMSPSELTETAALLFGSEKTGLSTEHMSYCHALVRIPTESGCPSMNLGQAVAVCCYELARFRRTTPHNGEDSSGPARVHLSAPATIQSVEHVFKRAERVLEEVGYLKPKSRNATLVKLRRFLFDRDLTNNDVKILGSVLAQIEWKLRISKPSGG